MAKKSCDTYIHLSGSDKCISCMYGSRFKKKEIENAVNHPGHYNKGIEVIKFIESWDLNFSRGSAIKYICRAGLKDPEKEIEDLRKVKAYIDFEIERIKRGSNENN